MSHHHRRHHHPDKDHNHEGKTVQSGGRSVFPLLNNNDIPFLSLIKPFLSPAGQKIIDLLIILSGNSDTKNASLDIPALLSKFNGIAENDAIKELLSTLSTGTGGGNQGATNPALVNTIMTLFNNKKESETNENE